MSPTTRVYWEDARRKTALATVTGHRAGGFTLDRSLFHAPDARYHHKQPVDRGHILADGHKLKITSVSWVHGALVHRTSGPLPPIGAKAQLHLDSDRRDEQARTHTAMHLLLAAIIDQRHELIAMPHTVGGAHVNLHAKLREAPKDALPKILAQAAGAIAQRVDIIATWHPRDDLAKKITHHAMALDAIAPEEPTLRAITIGKTCMPCDAPLVGNTRELGQLELRGVRQTNAGTQWQVRVHAPTLK